MDPLNYSGAFAGVQPPNDAFMQGIKDGAGVQSVLFQQNQQQAAIAQQQQMQADLANLSQNPTTQAIGQMAIKYPQLSEQFKRTFDMLAPAQQQAKLDHATQVYAALNSGEPQIAQKILTDQATALRNSGNEQDATAAETMAKLIDAHPDFAKTTAGLMISSAMGPDKFASAFGDISKEQRASDQAPADLRIKNAKAGADDADAAQKSLAVVGQTLGALQGKGAKPAQVATALNSLAARGVISKGDLPGYLAAVPSDPKQIDDWLGSVKMAGLKPDEQMKFTTPDANTLANNSTSVRTTSMNNATQIKVQQMIQDNKGSDDETAFTKELARMYPKGSPEYVEALRQRINKEAGINAGGGGGRSVVYNGRIIASGNEVAQALRNITELPVTSNAGFMGMGKPTSSGLLSAGLAGLKNDLNPDQIKTYNTMWTGVSRNLGTLETSGLATTGDLIKSIDKLQFVPGDNGYNALRKLAEVRQITEAALESKLHDPAVPGQQRDHIKDILDAVHAAVPYTHSDLTRFDKAAQKNPALTFQEFAGQTVNKGKQPAAPGAAPALPAGWAVEVH